MRELLLSAPLAVKLGALYEQMEKEYDAVAAVLNFGCEGCPDNCCDSYFRHHTYIEWAYLWRGLAELPAGKFKEVEKRSAEYITRCARAEARGERPQVMCPLNDKGLCILYPYRLLVCRTHGVPAVMHHPAGKALRFPGCFRCQEIVAERAGKEVPEVERTPLLRQLVLLEDELLDNRRHLYPKVKLTIAEMIVKGAPTVPE